MTLVNHECMKTSEILEGDAQCAIEKLQRTVLTVMLFYVDFFCCAINVHYHRSDTDFYICMSEQLCLYNCVCYTHKNINIYTVYFYPYKIPYGHVQKCCRDADILTCWATVSEIAMVYISNSSHRCIVWIR